MTGADPRAGGSHRRVDRGRRLRVLLVSLLVVVLAAGGVEAALHWRGESKRPSANAASSGYPRVSPSATPSSSTPSGSTSSALSSLADALAAARHDRPSGYSVHRIAGPEHDREHASGQAAGRHSERNPRQRHGGAG